MRSKGIPGFSKTLKTMDKVQRAKNHDYSGVVDPFANFELVEKFGVCSTEEGIVVRMTDKLSRISRLLKGDAKVLDEKVEDTLIDLANYAIILKCYMEAKRK